MSEPVRYDAGMLEKARPDGTGTMYVYAISEKSDGSFVSYEDYARLKAEVERLNAIVGADAIDREHGMCCDCSSENARLKEEVEYWKKGCER